MFDDISSKISAKKGCFDIMTELQFLFQAMKGFFEFFLIGFVLITVIGLAKGRRKFVGRIGHFEYNKAINKWVKTQNYRVPDGWNYETFVTQNQNSENKHEDRYYVN